MLRQQIQFFCRDLGYEVKFYEVDTSRHQVIYEDRSLTVESIPLCHRLPTCGFLFREKPSLPHIRRDMIDFYGVPQSQIQNIKNGADWTTADGEFVPNDRLVTPAEPPRSYAYCSDTRYLPELHQLLEGVSTLYHESTYGDDNLALAEKYNHSTASEAARVARDAHAGQLLLGHYSSRYEDEEILLREACSIFPNSRLTQEMMVVNV
jgi:ribonuclease Z